MEFSRTYTTIDAHAAGEPLRIVTAGIPRIPGDTILAKRAWLRDNLDHVRTTLMHEPRGHADMYGCYVVEPVTESADMGVIFMHNEGYSDMCGHGIIALATVAVAQGLVATSTPETRVGIDSPAGFIEAFVEFDGSRTGAVRFLNVPSFVLHTDLVVTTPGFGELTVDVVFGGAFYAYLSANAAGLVVRPDMALRLIDLGDQVKKAVSGAVQIRHPAVPDLNTLYGTIIDGPPADPANHQANVCVFADREVDRSPTGTGTAGRVAQLYARGRLALGETLRNESIIGTVFTGKAVSETSVVDGSTGQVLRAVVPEVAGRASITGFNQWVVAVDDELGGGFLVR
ncbi:MAG TPA: proline racemase family protein [Trueperaceae bacterium]|nr:proline racemase family protein [Trueperaceae bacterium]